MSTLCSPCRVGNVSVESGSIAVFDPCYLDSMPSNHLRFGYRINTEIGDGDFHVYEQRTSKGKLKRIIIEIE